jgi:hypothetical protein
MTPPFFLQPFIISSLKATTQTPLKQNFKMASSMAPPDDMEDVIKQLGALTISAAAEQVQSKIDGTFHLYINLPFEIREQIRIEAINAPVQPLFSELAYTPGRIGQDLTPLHELATVSNEWRVDVERLLWSEILVDPSKEDEVRRFKVLVKEERRKSLKRLDIPLDASISTGPWHQELGLLRISQVMARVGQLLQQINQNYESSEKKRPVQLIFTLDDYRYSTRQYRDKYPGFETSGSYFSLWEQSNLLAVTQQGVVPTDTTMWAIKSEFPSSVDRVTSLSAPIDCIPFSAARTLIQGMPNLATCVLAFKVSPFLAEGWPHLTGKPPKD